jgi:hypothetical protein
VKSDYIPVVLDLRNLADKIIAKKELLSYCAGIFAGFYPFYLIGFHDYKAHRTLFFISLTNVRPELGIPVSCPPLECIRELHRPDRPFAVVVVPKTDDQFAGR